MLSANEIVKIWEISVGKPLGEKAVLMLAPRFPETELGTLAAWSLGRRNAQLFRFREQVFGPVLNATSRCPACAEAIEFQLDTRVICDPSVPLPQQEHFLLRAEAYEIAHRSINSHDLSAVLPLLELEGPEAAEEELCFRCILSVSRAGDPLSPAALPAEILAQLAESLKLHDPHSEIICRLQCPACSESWPEPFDIAQFFWHELEMKAHLILQDVQALAKAFGWWEGDILSLSDARRKYYLEAIHE